MPQAATLKIVKTVSVPSGCPVEPHMKQCKDDFNFKYIYIDIYNA